MKVREFSNREATLSAKALGFHVVQGKPETWECGRGRRAKGLSFVPTFLHLSQDAPKTTGRRSRGRPAAKIHGEEYSCCGSKRSVRLGFIVVFGVGPHIKDLQARRTSTAWTWSSEGAELQGRSALDGEKVATITTP